MKILSGPWSKNKPANLLDRLRSSLNESEWSDENERDFERLVDAGIANASVATQTLDLIEDKIHDPATVIAAFLCFLGSHADDLELLIRMGDLAERSRNLNYLNDPPEEEALPRLIAALKSHDASNLKPKARERYLEALQLTARMAGRAFDQTTEDCCRELLSIRPDFPPHLFSLGLFLKTRGRFKEAVEVYEKALELDPEVGEGYLWNLGICATGARKPQVAMRAWSKLGIDLEVGAFDLPEADFAGVKVRLSEHPLAEREGREDEPGLEETIWIERLGPCHGIIRSVLYQDLGIDYGDLILFDGAPVTYHTYGKDEVPVFPHLTTLQHRQFQTFNFVASQPRSGAVDETNLELPSDTVIYVHSETVKTICRSCWEGLEQNHLHETGDEMNIVSGKIAAPRDTEATALLALLDSTMAQLDGIRIFSPELCEAAGDSDRAIFEAKRSALLETD